MSKRAEERALEAYPQVWDEEQDIDINERERFACIDGYEQAEKDLAMTWEDVKEIVHIADTMMDFDPNDRPEWMESDKAYYTEVLKRYLEAKK